MSKDEITSFKDADDELFRDAIQGLLRGDFSRLEPLFTNNSSPVGKSCHIIAGSLHLRLFSWANQYRGLPVEARR
jgi:hypothetical protein